MFLPSSSQASVLGDGGGGFCDKPFINSLVLTCQLVDKSAWQQTCKGSQTYLCKKIGRFDMDLGGNAVATLVMAYIATSFASFEVFRIYILQNNNISNG